MYLTLFRLGEGHPVVGTQENTEHINSYVPPVYGKCAVCVFMRHNLHSWIRYGLLAPRWYIVF